MEYFLKSASDGGIDIYPAAGVARFFVGCLKINCSHVCKLVK